MKRGGRSLATTRRVTSIALVLCLLSSIALYSGTSASGLGASERERASEDHKLSPDLRDRLALTSAPRRGPGDVREETEERVRVILQFKRKQRDRINRLLIDESIVETDDLHSF